jgi:hypothetical protein
MSRKKGHFIKFIIDKIALATAGRPAPKTTAFHPILNEVSILSTRISK